MSTTAATPNGVLQSIPPNSNRPLAAASPAPKKRPHNGREKKPRREGEGTDAAEKKVQVSSCDSCKEGHRK
ncbi:hypothetical protein BGZ65_009679, partial [Modicella reniformis]